MMHAPRAAHPSWGMIVLLGAMTMFGAMSIDMYLPAMPAIGRSLGAQPGDMARTLSSLLIGLALGQLVYGPLSDRIGRRVPILFGIALYVIASVACALSTDIWQLTIARFVQGLGACAALVVSRAVVRDRYDHQETARILSLLMLVFGLAPIVAPQIGSFALMFGDWRTIFFILAAFGAIVWVAVLVGLTESRSAATAAKARSETVFRAYWELLKNQRLLGYILTGALNGASLYIYIAISPDLIIGTYGIDPQHFGWIFSLNAAGLIAASQINRRLLLRHSTDKVLAGATLISLGWGVLMTIAAATGIGGLWGVLPPLFLILATFGFILANTTAGALSMDAQRAGTISGLSGVASFTVGAIVTASVGLVHDGTALPMASAMTASLVAAALSLFLLALRGARGAV